ncbi:MAG: zinc-ribbon domain-containing protein [Acidobacteriota bacterium]|nr:zinc-ribbon domain-containing protein [Acidobacteriota bacterium]
MIITCPHCSSRYKVKDGLITEKGKKVRCRKCGAVFIAYPNRDSVLEKPPEAAAYTVLQTGAAAAAAKQQAAPTPVPPKAAAPEPAPTQARPKAAAPPAPPKPAPAAPAPEHTGPQATVKVDRSQLDAFLKQSSNEPAIPPAPAAPTPQPNAQATVQVDRSKIDAIMKQGAAQPAAPTPEPPPTAAPDGPPPSEDVFATQALPAFDPHAAPPPQPEEEPDVFATQAMSSFDPSAFSPEAAPAPPPEPEPEPEPTPPDSDVFATQAMSSFDPNALATPPEQPSFDAPSETPAPASFDPDTEPSFQTSEPSIDNEPSFDTAPSINASGAEEPDFGDFGNLDSIAPPEEPAFPSDHELGIGNEPEPPVDQAAPTAELPTIEPPAEQAQDAAADFGSFDDAVPAQAQEPAAPTEKLYQARVDGNVYPSLSLDSIARWIQEGRLLETDEIALHNADNYARADAYPEIKPYFDQFYGSQSGAQPVEKKGFFAKLFSFKK